MGLNGRYENREETKKMTPLEEAQEILRNAEVNVNMAKLALLGAEAEVTVALRAVIAALEKRSRGGRRTRNVV